MKISSDAKLFPSSSEADELDEDVVKVEEAVISPISIRVETPDDAGAIGQVT